jgi:hypothetical protein
MDVVMDAASASAGMGDAPKVDENSFQQLLTQSGTLVKQGEEMMLTGTEQKGIGKVYFIFAILVKVWVTFGEESGKQALAQHDICIRRRKVGVVDKVVAHCVKNTVESGRQTTDPQQHVNVERATVLYPSTCMQGLCQVRSQTGDG